MGEGLYRTHIYMYISRCCTLGALCSVLLERERCSPMSVWCASVYDPADTRHNTTGREVVRPRDQA